MNRPSARELCLAALALAALTGAFLLAMRLRLGPLQENILIDAAGLIQQRPWMDFSGREFRDGFFPLWNPFTGFGQPHLANIQTAAFYPLNAALYLLGPVAGYNLWLFLRLWLAGFFIYLFLRKLNLAALPSFAGSLVWPLGGYGLWFMQLVELNSQLLLPLFLISLHALADRPRLKYFIGAALIGWMIILGGHPEAVFNSWLIAMLYFIFRLSRQKLPPSARLKRAALAGLVALVSAGLAAVVLLPFLNYLPRCWSLHFPGFGFFHLDVKTIPSLFFPDLDFASRGTGRIAVELLGKGISPVFKAGYLKTIAPGVLPGAGAVVMLLSLYGLLKTSRARPEFGFFAVALVFLLGLTYGLAPFNWAAFVPPFSSASNYKFYYSEIYFCLSIMVALGISGIPRGQKWLSPAVLLLLGFSLFFYSFAVNPYLKLDLKAMVNEPWLKLLESKSSSRGVPPRIAVIGEPGSVLPPNLAMFSRLDDISSSDALFPEAYFRLMDKLNGLAPGQRLDYFYPGYYVRLLKSAVYNPLFDRYGINFVAANFLSEAEINELANWGFAQRAPAAETGGKASPVFSNALLEKYSAWPRAFVVDEPGEALYQNGARDFSRAAIISYQSQKVDLSADLRRPGHLVLSDLYHPGWRAFVDGKEAPVRELLNGFRSVDLDRGRHELVFRFQPVDFRIGLELSLAGIIMVCAAWFLRGRNVKKA